MADPTQSDDRAHDYLDGLADKLEDPDAYLRFLEAKLERTDGRRRVLESGVQPAIPRAELPPKSAAS